jgi:hypothetical protein
MYVLPSDAGQDNGEAMVAAVDVVVELNKVFAEDRTTLDVDKEATKLVEGTVEMLDTKFDIDKNVGIDATPDLVAEDRGVNDNGIIPTDNVAGAVEATVPLAYSCR